MKFHTMHRTQQQLKHFRKLYFVLQIHIYHLSLPLPHESKKKYQTFMNHSIHFYLQSPVNS